MGSNPTLSASLLVFKSSAALQKSLHSAFLYYKSRRCALSGGVRSFSVQASLRFLLGVFLGGIFRLRQKYPQMGTSIASEYRDDRGSSLRMPSPRDLHGVRAGIDVRTGSDVTGVPVSSNVGATRGRPYALHHRCVVPLIPVKYRLHDVTTRFSTRFMVHFRYPLAGLECCPKIMGKSVPRRERFLMDLHSLMRWRVLAALIKLYYLLFACAVSPSL